MNDENEMVLGKINDVARSILVRDGFHNIVLYTVGEEAMISPILPIDASCEAILSKLRLMELDRYAVVRETQNGGRGHLLRVLLVTKDDGMGEIITEFQRVGSRVIIGDSQREAEVMKSDWSIWGKTQIDLGEWEDDVDE
jgi:hypothetical protein